MPLIVLATRNNHKAAELAAMLGDKFTVKTLRDFPAAPETIEDAPTFHGNATKKAVTLANWLTQFNWSDSFVLADDSGLEVDALGGDPGVRSARFAATNETGNSPDAANNEKLLRLLAPIPRPWTARFRCVIAFTPIPEAPKETASNTCLLDEAEAATRLFDGACEGQIIPTPQGAHGFGYDPLFIPNGFTQTFAELGDDQKNRISHRAEAMKKFLTALRAQS